MSHSVILILFIILYTLYHKQNFGIKKGFFLAFFLIFLFGVRFVVEYVKESQGGIENYQVTHYRSVAEYTFYVNWTNNTF